MKIKAPHLTHYFEGNEVEIDQSIYDMIMKFNSVGCTTYSCCSGLPEDHDGDEQFHFYISFSKKINKKFIDIADSFGLTTNNWNTGTWIGIDPNIRRTVSNDVVRKVISKFNEVLDNDIKLYGRFGNKLCVL